jgi:hypothetical protein
LQNERARIENIAIIRNRRTAIWHLTRKLRLLRVDQFAGVVLANHYHAILPWIRGCDDAELRLCPAISEILVCFSADDLAMNARGDGKKRSYEKGHGDSVRRRGTDWMYGGLRIRMMTATVILPLFRRLQWGSCNLEILICKQTA